jgi:WD40-like Beta Propeller Repeat
MRGMGRWQNALALLVAAVAGLVPAPAAAEESASPRFVVSSNPFLLGQAMDWLDERHVVWHDPVVRDEDGDGETQIYRSTLDGAEKVCLTCGLDGPNQVPVVQPHGRWILFHSWSGHTTTLGGPGFGGLGSDVWVMTRDGGQRTNLTQSGELRDNFHAYWSPDGRYIVWTALDWNTAEGGTGKSDVRVARFDAHGPNGPRLVGEHAVRPGNGHWYETQWWAPDGSGFLYTETVDTAINPELFFCRLPDPARGACHPVRLTHDPAWDEQAIFTPDMRRVLFMSSRNLPGAHNDWAMAATLLDIPAEYDYQLVLLVFADSFLQPVLQQATDLYEMRLRWNAGRTRFKPGRVRRLTRSGDDGWVIPEFAWDPGGQRLLWTQNKFGAGRRVDQGCLVRQIRAELIEQMSRVQTIGQIPFGVPNQIRDQAAGLMKNPRLVTGRTGCGGDQPNAEPAWAQETWLGRFAE